MSRSMLTSSQLVSIVMPTYNYDAYIRKALSSIFEQDYKNYELIIVDDGSTDNTASIVKEMQHKFATSLKYIYQRNAGVGAARNTGLSESSGMYVTFLDSDDYWEPNTLSRLVAYMDSHQDAMMVYGNVRALDITTGKHLGNYYGPNAYRIPYSGRIADKLCRFDNYIHTDTVMIRRCVFDELGRFNPSLRTGEDLDMWIRIARKYSIHYIDDVLANVRSHPDSLSFNDSKNIYAMWWVTKNIRNHMPDIVSAVGQSYLSRKLARYYYGLASKRFMRGQYVTARRLFKKCFYLDPIIIFKQKWIPYYILTLPGLHIISNLAKKFKNKRIQTGLKV